MSLDDALRRGRDAVVASIISARGIPADRERWLQFQAHREGMKRRLIRSSEFAFLFDDVVRKEDRWEQYLDDQGLLAGWTKTDTSKKPSTKLDVLADNAKEHPQLEPLLELQRKLDLLDKSSTAIGDDGRNRSELRAYATSTGRYTRRNGEMLVSKDHVFRGFLRPEPGWCIADLDYSRQEWWVGAHLSGDPAMQSFAASEDIYVELARRVGQWPDGATKATHKPTRDRFKVVALGINYGMQPRRLSEEVGISLVEAEELHRAIKDEFPEFFAWTARTVAEAQRDGVIRSPLGFAMRVVDEPGFRTKPTTLLDFKMQSGGADMTRTAARLAVEAELPVGFIHHDSMVLDAREGEIADLVQRAKDVMAKAAVEVVGIEIPVEARVVHHPDSLLEPEDAERWAELCQLLDAEIAEPSEPPPKTRKTRKRKSPGGEEGPKYQQPSFGGSQANTEGVSSPNGSLLPEHREKLESSGVSDEVVQARGYRSITDRAELDALRFAPRLSPAPGLLIPLHGVDGLVVGHQYRPDTPSVDEKGKTNKYVNPRGQRMVLDIPVAAWGQLDDPAIPLLVTEGPMKADSAVSSGLCCVALLGVRCWTGTNAKGGKTALGEWRSVALNGRTVSVVYDSDLSEKDEVRDALAEFGSFLVSKGAKPYQAKERRP